MMITNDKSIDIDKDRITPLRELLSAELDRCFSTLNSFNTSINNENDENNKLEFHRDKKLQQHNQKQEQQKDVADLLQIIRKKILLLTELNERLKFYSDELNEQLELKEMNLDD
ncbi:MAG: hypothetical protein HQK49_00245 [Oligoflexia bacterium]|nr:hypothetical protein [Oligoflexia bacterium]